MIETGIMVMGETYALNKECIIRKYGTKIYKMYFYDITKLIPLIKEILGTEYGSLERFSLMARLWRTVRGMVKRRG